jgi:hypothetical protein
LRNRPRGSKLDANKRAEYQSEVGGVETWDISAWPRWTITGRVMPERCDVRVPVVISQGMGALGRFRLRLEVTRSHIAAVVATEKESPSVFEITDVVRSALWFPVDYIAFQNRAAYEIVLDLCLNNQTGEAQPIPVFEPIFEAEEAGLSFDARSDKSNILIPFAAAAVLSCQPLCTMLPQPCAIHAVPSNTVVWRRKLFGGTLTRRLSGVTLIGGVRAKPLCAPPST